MPIAPMKRIPKTLQKGQDKVFMAIRKNRGRIILNGLESFLNP